MKCSVCALGYDRRTIHDIEVGNTHKGDGMSDVVKDAKELIGSAEGLLALDGELNSTVYIFRAKNYQGMTDKQEVVLTPNSIPDEQVNAEDIIKNLPGIDESKPLQIENK